MRRKFILLILFLSLFSPAIYADNQVHVVIHVNDGFKLGDLENSVQNIRKEMGDSIDIRVVINGKAVKRLLRSNVDSTRIVNNVLKENVPIGLCHNALASNKVDKSMLIKGVEVLPTDGNVTIINYQKQGFLYIKL